MKITTLFVGLALSTAPAIAQVAVENIAPLPATVATPQMATVTPFITGLKEPQGMVVDGIGNLFVCDYGAGKILVFSRTGRELGEMAPYSILKGPSAIVRTDNGDVFVTERKANRVLRFRDTKMDVVMDDIPEPIGLVINPLITSNFGKETPFSLGVVSHTTSKVYQLLLSNTRERELIYAAPAIGAEERYGFRWLVTDASTLLMSDEVGEKILMVNRAGRASTFASGISDPSGIAIGPDKMVYVANEGNGGQLIRLNSEGEKTIVAEKLGRPRGILFLDAKTALVSNRDGNIWKVVLP
jgi:DNA-binding beta-propeller fold protein YncE